MLFHRSLHYNAWRSTSKRWLQAGGMLLAGTLVYWLTRENLPVLIQPLDEASWRMANPSVAALPVAVQKAVNTLPSFFHCYALIAASAALNLRQRAFLIWGAGFSSVMCLAMEFVQHSFIATWLVEHTQNSGNFLFDSLANYAVKGTFDGLDISAIIAATLLAIGQFYRFEKPADYSGEDECPSP